MQNPSNTRPSHRASLTARRSPKLPLGSLRVAAILKAANRAKYSMPRQKLGRVHEEFRVQSLPLMLEMPPAGEDHRDAVLVAGRDDFVVADAAARLNDRGNARRGGLVDRVGEREKGIGGEDRTRGPLARLSSWRFRPNRRGSSGRRRRRRATVSFASTIALLSRAGRRPSRTADRPVARRSAALSVTTFHSLSGSGRTSAVLHEHAAADWPVAQRRRPAARCRRPPAAARWLSTWASS